NHQQSKSKREVTLPRTKNDECTRRILWGLEKTLKISRNARRNLESEIVGAHCETSYFQSPTNKSEPPEAPEVVAANLGQPKSQRFYRPELDTLRFFAFLGVFIFHVIPHDSESYLSHHVLPSRVVPFVCAISGAGAFGVDLFFALSAYLITILLIREEELRGTIDTSAFYIRRILRIWPLYFFFIAVAAVVPIWDKAQHLSWHYIAGYLLLAGNWVYVWQGLPHSIANPLWSVSIEEQ